jgi:DNA-binding IclR family transcriptional regulator
LLRLLAEERGPGLGIADVCERSRLHRVTAHRLLANLMREGFVEQDEQRRYHLGVEAWRMGVSASRVFDLVKIADPSLDTIEQEMQDTTFLLKRSGNEAICVARREGTYLDPEDADRALAETETKLHRFPSISIPLIRQMAEETRTRGFALSRGLIVPSAYSAAVPIFDAAGRPIGSFACAAAPDRLSGERLDFVVQTMRREAEIVTARLSGRPQHADQATPPKAMKRPRTSVHTRAH